MDAADVDAPPAITGQRVSGKAMDYFGNTAMADSTIATDGVTPPVTATSIADGSYALDNVPSGSKVFLQVTHQNYRPTRNPVVTVDEMPVLQDVYQMASADVTRQYTTLGRAPTAGQAFVVAELRRNNGTPLDTALLTDISLVDAANAPVPNVLPIAFGTVGDVDGALLSATLINGKTRVAFFDVPPGSYTIKLNLLNNQGQVQVQDTPVTALADGATLVLTGGTGGGGGGMQGPNVDDPKFATDVYPALQRAATGGLGCGTCHTATGPGAVLVLDDGAATVQARLVAKLGLIDTTTPALSLFLTKPLYEPPPAPQNHPNATFLDANDPYYRMLAAWIAQGLAP
ncbi:MAG: hypothetical protein KF773_37250 [Deltaproteobacteria bacterium]|nr:hypothetical protein [Deltaproteobacteria bacterium]